MREDAFGWLEPLVPYVVGYLIFLILLRVLLLAIYGQWKRGGFVRPVLRLLLCFLRAAMVLAAVLIVFWVLAAFGLFTPFLEYLSELPVVEVDRFDLSFSTGWIVMGPLLILFGIWVLRLFFGCIIRPRKPLYSYLFFWR